MLLDPEGCTSSKLPARLVCPDNKAAKKIIEIVSNPKKENLIEHAREDVMRADWEIVSQIHWDKVYKPALNELNENINL